MGIKAFDALLEVVMGFLLFTPMKLGDFLAKVNQAEIFEHLGVERTANVLHHHAATAIHHSSVGTAVYLVIHGVAKLIFIGGAFWQKPWGYIGLTIILTIFIVFELFHAATKGSLFMLSMAVFDALIAFLAWREYRNLASAKGRAQGAPSSSKASVSLGD